MIRIPFDFGHGIVLSLIVITPTNSNAMLFFCLFCFGFCVPRWLVVTSLMTPLFRFAFMSAWLLSSSFWAWPLMRQHREPTQLWLDSCFYTWTTTCLAEYWFSLSHHHALCRAWIYYVYRQLNWLFLYQDHLSLLLATQRYIRIPYYPYYIDRINKMCLSWTFQFIVKSPLNYLLWYGINFRAY